MTWSYQSKNQKEDSKTSEEAKKPSLPIASYFTADRISLYVLLGCWSYY